MKLPKYSAMLAKEVVRFHLLQIPIVRDPNFSFNDATKKLDRIMCETFEDPEFLENHEQFLKFDIKNELDQLMCVYIKNQFNFCKFVYKI